MAAKALLPLLLLCLLLTLFVSSVSTKSTGVNPFTCSDRSQKTCTSLLYQHNNLRKEQVVSFYSINESQITPISHGYEQNFLVSVPCSCQEANGAVGVNVGYFYNTVYKMQDKETSADVSSKIYSGQAWEVGSYEPGEEVPIHLMCGCAEIETQIIVTYTVQQSDTLADIAALLSARTSEIQRLNKIPTENPGFIDVGWVLFVPMEKNGIPCPNSGIAHKYWIIIICILAAAALLSVGTLAIILVGRYGNQQNVEEDPKPVLKRKYTNNSFHLQSQCLHEEKMEDIKIFESERPAICSLEEIAEATNSFDETRKIGEGGYGIVYFGIMGEQEVAIKKMRSNKTKEFFAELKVLCKIHHINVVELLSYASGEDHLYLVYEYIPNGSLSDHLHDPLLKGHRSLSWTARTHIALDAAKGIEYIHDHTKTQYVHRDIKTSNILLDKGLRAKVADFGLAKLVERTNEDDLIATCIVGTPGYLPPECVKEYQVTTKTDVFAFGVVLAELITGQRALIRDNREPYKMKSLVTLVHKVFQDEEPETELESIMDGNLRGNYPLELAYKMAELAEWCLSEEAVNRPEMREVVVVLCEIAISSAEWEASLGGDNQVFSGVCTGR